MLQQTQVETVIPYFNRFLSCFPDVQALASADPDLVMACWSGLGYYSRARNLHAAAREIVSKHGGLFPREPDDIAMLPGIGRSTAAAIGAFAFGRRTAILDGNVKRVLARVFGQEGWPGERAVETRLWALAETLLPADGIQAYTQGLMDLGATVCVRARPRCAVCPFSRECIANRTGRQGELPGPRPRKALPEKQTAMLVLVHAGQMLLEKRPATGIWGGLWSLPECSPQDDVRQVAGGQGYAVDAVKALPGMTHGFTHFRLAISPWLLYVHSVSRMEEPGRIWLPVGDAAGAAIPAPVRRIVQSLADEL